MVLSSNMGHCKFNKCIYTQLKPVENENAKIRNFGYKGRYMGSPKKIKSLEKATNDIKSDFFSYPCYFLGLNLHS